MDPRLIRNLPVLSEAEQQMLSEKHVLVAGCGGLGGFVVEFLVRAGVGKITAADPDSFELSNRNRQLLSLESTLHQNKALAAAARAKDINPNVVFHPVETRLDAETLPELLQTCDLAVDALDSAADRLTLAEACGAQGLHLVHGAVHGWAAQTAVVPPGSDLLHRLYSAAAPPADSAVLSPVPAFCAAVQCAEAIRLLCGQPSALENKLLIADLQSMDISTMEF